jgi:DNA polymerase III delta prime subunit
MNQLFLTKYQPKLLSDFDTNDDLIDVINTLLSINNLNVLFIGSAGTGKTTYVNAIIREYYKNVSSYSSNILYINSLKDHGINFCRNEVKTFCQTYSNIIGKKKIVVLDDIDFINEQSQQVFRNFIDKYSSIVHFIATCSNSQKIIGTLQSRLTILKIKQLTNDQLSKFMNKIMTTEELIISPEAQNLILNVSNGSAKKMTNYLEKIKLIDVPVDFQLANQLCSNISFLIFEEYTQHLLNKNLLDAINIIYELFDKGYSVIDILDNYFVFAKITNMLNETQKYEIIPIICKYIAIFYNIHEDEIELSLFTNNIYNAINNVINI